METSVTLMRWIAALLIIQETYCACIPSYHQDQYHTPILHKCVENAESDITSHNCPQYNCNNHCQHVYTGYDTGSTSGVCSEHKLLCTHESTGKGCTSHCANCQTEEVHEEEHSGYFPSGQNIPGVCGYPVCGRDVSTYDAELHRPCTTVSCGCQRHYCGDVDDNYYYYHQPSCGCKQNVTKELPTTTVPLPTTTTAKPTTTASVSTTQITPKLSEKSSVVPRFSDAWTFPVHPKPEDLLFFKT